MAEKPGVCTITFFPIRRALISLQLCCLALSDGKIASVSSKNCLQYTPSCF